MSENAVQVWRKCNSCKKAIGFNSKYYVCSVSTCNGQRTGYVFCSVSCFEVHLPGARHKDAAAIEAKSPGPGSAAAASGDGDSSSASSSAAGGASSSAPGNRRVIVGASTGAPSASKNQIPRDVLIIASRLKEYIQARADMNTSGQVMEVLSEFVRRACDRAIDNARAEGRKTVMERDFKA